MDSTTIIILCIAFGPIGLVIASQIVQVLFAQKTTVSLLEEMGKPLPERFCLSDYYDRIIEVSEEIAREKNERKYEPIILWLILDGLQINADGSFEWIHKKQQLSQVEAFAENLKYISQSYGILYADNAPVEVTINEDDFLWEQAGTPGRVPFIGSNGNWQCYSPYYGAFIDSGIRANTSPGSSVTMTTY